MRLYAEWMPYMKSYRLYDPRNPQQTVAYEDNEETAKKHAIENGYDGIVIYDADKMHVNMPNYLKRAELSIIPKEADVSVDDCEIIAKSKDFCGFYAVLGQLGDEYYLFEKNKPCRPLHLASTYTSSGEITRLIFQYTPDNLHVYHVSCNPQTHILGNPESHALELEDITAGMSCSYAGITLTYNGKGSVTIQADGKTKEMKVEDNPKYAYKFLKTKIKAKDGAEGLYAFMEQIAENKKTYGETPYCGAYEILGSVFEKPRQIERD